MQRRLISHRWSWVAGLAAAAVGACLAARPLLLWLSAVLLRDTRGQDPVAEALPAGCVLAVATAGTQVQAPFEITASAASPGGVAVSLPEGRGDKARCAGRVSVPVRIETSGRYRLWLRSRWSDSCSNSIAVAVDGGELATVGQDAVYDLWHWIDAGEHELSAGGHTLVLAEREDGVAVDQALLSPSVAFVPTGPILDPHRQGAGMRRFADGFDRSPGHGNDGWLFRSGTWDIAFSLDPNRVPLQYALTGTPAAGQWAVAAVAGPPWRGAVVDVAFHRDTPATAVGVLFSTAAGPVAVTLGPQTQAEGLADATVIRLEGDSLETGQWYRLQVERWAWSLRVRLDGRTLHRIDGLPAAECGVPALLVAGGTAGFDDVAVSEVPWEADDGRDFRLAWSAAADARWYRPRREDAGWALAARAGALHWAPREWPLGEVLVEGATARALSRLCLPGLRAMTDASEGLFGPVGDPPCDLVLAASGPCRLRRLSVRLAPPQPADASHLGVYHFTEPEIPDLADYLDFTPEERQQIAASSDPEKLRRQAKHFSLVGRSADYAVWESRNGAWRVADGVLRAAGHDAALRFWQEINGPCRVQFRVRLADTQSAARLVLAEEQGNGIALRLAATGAAAPPGQPAAVLAPAEWHALTVDLADDALHWRVDEGASCRQEIRRGPGGGVVLELARGQAEFDDILFSLPRRTDVPGARSRFYAFDRREPDWWRRGPWLDHGGIACAVASSWISLDSLEAAGYLIHKDCFAPDVQVACNVEENTEWLGWDRDPSHRHYPEDNLHILLLPASRDVSRGYRLEVNSGEQRRTVLYRDGVEVAAVTPGDDFPMHYVGGHAPYRPRRNRIRLERQGDRVRGVINGVEVLTYRDPRPLDTVTVALGGDRTRVNFSNVLVRELPPLRPGA